MFPGCNPQLFPELIFRGDSLFFFFFFNWKQAKVLQCTLLKTYSDVAEWEAKLNQYIIALLPTLFKLAQKNQKYSHEYGFCILFQIIVKANEKSWNNGDGNSPYTICSAIYYMEKKKKTVHMDNSAVLQYYFYN